LQSSGKDKTLVSVVVPVYNSQDTLYDLLQGIMNAVNRKMYNLEVIFVDDYSNIIVWSKLKELKSQFPDIIHIVRLTRNFGQNNATLCGLELAKGEWVITIDDDLEFDPADIPKLLQTALYANSDVVYGVVKHKGLNARSLGRRLLFFVLRRFENGANLGSSFRVIHRSIINHILQHNQDHIFINQLISWYTKDVEYVEIIKSEKYKKRSGYNFFSLIRMGLRIIFYYTSLPIKLVVYFSFLVAIICLVFAFYYVIQKLTIGTLQGYSSMIVAVFASTAIIMISIGVLGIFVNRIYNNRIKKPNYSVKRPAN